jgi:hypothetical protein
MGVSDFFANSSLLGIFLALVFGAIWLVPLAPLRWRRSSVWLVFLGGIILFIPAILWVQVPIQNAIGNWFLNQFGLETYQQRILLLGIPTVLVSGMVQEGAKLFPVIACWLYGGQKIDPKLGLSIGALSGVGFGIFEAQWLNNAILAEGWTWGLVGQYGIVALAGFGERFFSVGFHTATGALAGWGLAKGLTWQFYLLASFVHFAVNYLILPYQKGMLTYEQFEIIFAILVLLVFAGILWLRWRKPARPAAAGIIETAPVMPGEASGDTAAQKPGAGTEPPQADR